MIITIPTATLCIKSDPPAAVRERCVVVYDLFEQSVFVNSELAVAFARGPPRKVA
jgi:hypothetical protein